MRYLQKIKRRLLKAVGIKPKRPPLGLDVFADIKSRMPYYPLQVCLDVGAHFGESASVMRVHFPEAQIHCLEPFSETFKILSRNTRHSRVFCHQVALGAFNGHVDVQRDVENKDSSRNSLRPANYMHDPARRTTERVDVTTLTDFCRAHDIPFIDFLKIDTEGYDLEVLQGGASLLDSASVMFVQTEVAMNPLNTFHVSFESIRLYLENYGYFLFGIYEQKHEWNPVRPILRRADAVFIAEKLVTPDRLKELKQKHALHGAK